MNLNQPRQGLDAGPGSRESRETVGVGLSLFLLLPWSYSAGSGNISRKQQPSLQPVSTPESSSPRYSVVVLSKVPFYRESQTLFFSSWVRRHGSAEQLIGFPKEKQQALENWGWLPCFPASSTKQQTVGHTTSVFLWVTGRKAWHFLFYFHIEGHKFSFLENICHLEHAYTNSLLGSYKCCAVGSI